ncbi:hypothetical protein RYX36_029974 [Vicia faba]
MCKLLVQQKQLILGPMVRMYLQTYSSFHVQTRLMIELDFHKIPPYQKLYSRLFDDERSLGLTGINWNDSLGPFDLGMPPKKRIGGDNIGIGEFVK